MANKPTNPQLYSRVKAEAKKKFDRWPSAYGSAWLVKEYKRRGGGYRKAEDGMEVQGSVNQMMADLSMMANGGMMYGDYQFPFMDEGGEMALGQIAAVTDKMSKLQQFLNPNSDVEPWVASKLAVMDDSAGAIYDYMMYNPEAQEEGEMEEMRNGGIPQRYKNQGFTRVGAKRQSTRPGKKWMVLAKKGNKYKVVHGGYKGMSDFTRHRNENRRERFWNRMGGRNSAKAKDPFSPLYWHKRFGTWAEGGEPQNEGFQALPEAVQAKIMANMMYGGDMYQKGGENDSTLENILEVFDPTGITSWDDVYRAATNPKASKEEVALEVFGALPFLGKVGKAGKYAAMAADAFAVTARQKRNAQAVAAAMRAVPYVGRATDAAQAVQQAPTAPLFPQKKNGGDMYAMGGMPCYECGGTKMKKGGIPFIAMAYFRDGGIELDPAKKGTFKAMATRMGLSVQEAAKKILDAPEGKYSPEMRRKANFARNFAKQDGGPQLDFSAFENMEPIMEIPNDEKVPFMPGRSKNIYATEDFVAGLRGPKGGFNPFIAGNDGDESFRIQASDFLKPGMIGRGLVNAAGWLGRGRKESQAQYDINNRFLTDNLYEAMPMGISGERGNFDAFGNFRPDETLASRTYYNQMGGEIEMTDDQIRQLVALGAEIEILD
jgi:hypothetical protein